ncbi:hypothetical protein [Halorubrum salipaludis]|uniref:hypothetical protein n=1 Tax=Halorubrum salipaludis TaxID=2032630 RepID=UPI001181B0C1|nr:hypothetical protein [Halorubrum salipaludis]
MDPENDKKIRNVIRSAVIRILYDVFGGAAIVIIFTFSLFIFSFITVVLAQFDLIELVNLDILNPTFIKWSVGILFLFLAWVTATEYIEQFDNLIESIGDMIWGATTDVDAFSEPYDERGSYQEYKDEYLSYFSQLAPVGFVLLLAPLPFTLGYYGRVNLQLLAGSYLITAIFLQGRSNTFHHSPSNINNSIQSDVRQRATTHYEFVFFLLAGIVQTAASLGANTEQLAGFILLIFSALGSIAITIIFVIRLPQLDL